MSGGHKVRTKTQKAPGKASGAGLERRGRPKRSDEFDARARILDAAEHLFARKGLHGTALREIARDAQLNPNLVSYYFADKEALFTELVVTRARWINERREALLIAAEEACAPEQPTVEAIMVCFVRPIFEMKLKDAGAWTRLYDLLSRESGSALSQRVLRQTLGPIMRRFAILLHRVLPTARRRDVTFLLELALHATILASPPHARLVLDESMADEWNEDELENQIVRTMTASAAALLRDG